MLGSWLRGRADSIIASSAVAAQTTGRSHSSSIIKTEGLLMQWWGFKCLWRAHSLCGFLFVLPGFSHCSQPGGPRSRRLSYWKQFISKLFRLINLNLARINLFLTVNVYLCPLSVINNCLYLRLTLVFFSQGPIYVSFVSKAILWERGLCHHTVSAKTLFKQQGTWILFFFYYPKSLAFFCEACSYDMFLVGTSDLHTSCSFILMSGQNWCFEATLRFYVTQELKEALSRQQHIEILLPWSCSVTDPKRGVVSFDSSHSSTGGIGTSENV